VVGAIIAVAATLKPKIRDTYDKLGDKVKTKVESVTFD
jgi:Flp pilus assembly pilin Flp